MIAMAPTPVHLPVMPEEVMHYLAPRPGGAYIDCTTGLGGHSKRIAEAIGPEGRLLCIDQDGEALEFARANLNPFGRRIKFARGNFSELAAIAAANGFDAADGILMDLGVSSLQFDTALRGFSFSHEGPLDMRMSREAGVLTAGEIVNQWEESEIADVLWKYGEIGQSRRVAAAIVRARPLTTTTDLAQVSEQALGGSRNHQKIHPATQVFLALRIRVNGELDSLDSVLPQARGLLSLGPAGGGRLVAISFHSLEDRVVKQYIRREATGCICPPELPVCRCGHIATLRDLTRRAIRPGPAEVAANPRARSAVLRAAERVA